MMCVFPVPADVADRTDAADVHHYGAARVAHQAWVAKVRTCSARLHHGGEPVADALDGLERIAERSGDALRRGDTQAVWDIMELGHGLTAQLAPPGCHDLFTNPTRPYGSGGAVVGGSTVE